MTNSLPTNKPTYETEPLESQVVELEPARVSEPRHAAPAHAAGAHAAQGAAPQGTVIRKRKRSSSRRKKKQARIAIIVCSVLVVLAVTLGATASFLINSGRVNLQSGDFSGITFSDEAESFNGGQTIEYKGDTYVLNENMVSVCIIGFDKSASTAHMTGYASGQADAVMVFALDTMTGEATIIGIPRDSMMEVGQFVGDAFLGQETMQLCLAFSYGDTLEKSCDYVTTLASRTLYNMPITHYLAMDMAGIEPMNDAIGGVLLTPLQSIPGTNVVKDQPIELWGYDAYQYIHYRDIYEFGSAVGRQERQVQYLKAYTSQALTAAQGDVGVLLDLYNAALEYSVTNLGVSEFTYLATILVDRGITSMNVLALDGTVQEGAQNDEFYLDKDHVYETVLDTYYTKIDITGGEGEAAEGEGEAAE